MREPMPKWQLNSTGVLQLAHIEHSIHRLMTSREEGESENILYIMLLHICKQTHTCQHSAIRTESPSFSSRQNLRPRRRKSPSFEIWFVFFFFFSSHHFGFSSYYPDEWAKTAMASRLSGSRHRAGNARKMKAYKAHFNPDSVQEWPAVIAKSHEGDTDAFWRLCRCDFSVSSGESKRTRTILW